MHCVHLAALATLLGQKCKILPIHAFPRKGKNVITVSAFLKYFFFKKNSVLDLLLFVTYRTASIILSFNHHWLLENLSWETGMSIYHWIYIISLLYLYFFLRLMSRMQGIRIIMLLFSAWYIVLLTVLALFLFLKILCYPYQ